MAQWDIGFPVNFTANGDLTRHAIGKHIKEFLKVYGHLNDLRGFSGGMEPPEDPGENSVWFDASDATLKVYKDDTWQDMIRVYAASASDDSAKLGGELPEYYATALALFNLQASLSGYVTDEELDTALNSVLSRSQFVFKGPWQGGGGYAPYNVVEFQGSSFLLVDGDGLIPPPDTRYWVLVAAARHQDMLDTIDGGHAASRPVSFIDGGGA